MSPKYDIDWDLSGYRPPPRGNSHWEEVKAYRSHHECRKTHRTWSGLAKCLWPLVRAVTGDGQYALLVNVRCEYAQWYADQKWRSHHTRLYVHLYPTLAEARQAQTEAPDWEYDPDDRGVTVTITGCYFVSADVLRMPVLRAS